MGPGPWGCSAWGRATVAGCRLAAFLSWRIFARETRASGSRECEQSPQARSPPGETFIAPMA